ncbi:endoribonuclease YbeY isoform X2 [Pogona vitticeps]|uniref:Endoribonuclease YbeY isoform X2 n=1 Tax=Pogona vitticeps TaxID=103695 RepID=A0A6J0UW14_9SAUR|nr:putative ribonuclease isoform X2 [Pogona vitticeps]
MSLIIRNLQQTISIRRVPLRKKTEQLRCILGVQQFDLGLICVSNRHIQWLNKTYKGKNIPTDVLAFPFHEVTVAHGMCHLLGYKHNTEADWLQMYEKEIQVLQALNKLSGTNLQPLTKNHF